MTSKRFERWRTWSLLGIASAGLALSIFWLLTVLPDTYSDLAVYRVSIQGWWQGWDLYGTVPEDANESYLPFVYPPFSILALGPLAIVSFAAAKIVLYVLGFLSIAVTIYVVSRRVWPSLDRRGGLLVAALAAPLTIFLEPVAKTFEFGQVSLIFMAIIIIECLAPKTWWPRGIGIGVIAAIKLTPLIFLLFFLVRKDYRALIIATATALGATIVGFIIDSHASISYWFGGLITGQGVGGSAFPTNQAIEAVLVRTGLPTHLVTVFWILASLILITLTALAMKKSEAALALIANAGLGLLISPTSWSHYWVWVVPTLVVMAGYVRRRWREQSLAIAGWITAMTLTFAVCYLAPFLYLPEMSFPVVIRRWTPKEQALAGSYVLLGLGLLLIYAIPRWGRENLEADTFINSAVENGNPVEPAKLKAGEHSHGA